MILMASLLHDDIIDAGEVRKNKISVYKVWGEKKATFAADFILGRANKLLTETGNVEIIIRFQQAYLDVVRGELIQLESRENSDQVIDHSRLVIAKKFASLIACTCQSMAVLSKASLELQNAAYEYGMNLGITFQLIEEVLDFVSNPAEMGKPTNVDLQLGLATVPVLFACKKYPEMNNLIMRRFSQPGDVDKAYEMVMNSDGIENTRLLAKKHCDEALKNISYLEDTPEKKALITLTQSVLTKS